MRFRVGELQSRAIAEKTGICHFPNGPVPPFEIGGFQRVDEHARRGRQGERRTGAALTVDDATNVTSTVTIAIVAAERCLARPRVNDVSLHPNELAAPARKASLSPRAGGERFSRSGSTPVPSEAQILQACFYPRHASRCLP